MGIEKLYEIRRKKLNKLKWIIVMNYSEIYQEEGIDENYLNEFFKEVKGEILKNA